MRNADDNNPNDHHIIPRSKRGKTKRWNIAIVRQKDHQNYHNLFVNKTPDEILDYLSNYFWKNKEGVNGERFIRQYLNDIPYRIE